MPFSIVCTVPEKFATPKAFGVASTRDARTRAGQAVRYPDVRVLVWIQSLRAFLEGGGFAAQMRKRFAGEMQ